MKAICHLHDIRRTLLISRESLLGVRNPAWLLFTSAAASVSLLRLQVEMVKGTIIDNGKASTLLLVDMSALPVSIKRIAP